MKLEDKIDKQLQIIQRNIVKNQSPKMDGSHTINHSECSKACVLIHNHCRDIAAERDKYKEAVVRHTADLKGVIRLLEDVLK